jgi:hypothetical protein
MRVGLWLAFFLVSNLVGVEVFKAAVTLPSDEALLPAILTLPFIGSAAYGASRLVDAWHSRRR